MSSADGVDFLRERFAAAGQVPPAAPVPGPVADEVAAVAVDRDRQFTKFVRYHQADLLRTAWLLCGDRHQAEELVQQALVRTYSRWGHVRQRDPLGYTRRVLANLRVDHWRRRRREVLVPPDEDVRCKTEVDFAPRMADARAAARAPVLAKSRDELEARLAHQRAAVAAAEAYLAAHPEIP